MSLSRVFLPFVVSVALVAGLTGVACAGPEHPMSDLPLKSQRRMYTDEEIAQGRRNLAQYESARDAARRTVFEKADAWLGWEDDALAALVPDATVPRAFNVGTAGCPVHGTAIYEKAGTYPWKLDPRKPFQVTCPVGGESYPSNDFAAYYRAGMDAPALLTGDYPDDGWGWEGPDGHRYWFVAYANHWTIYEHVIPGLRALADAYLLTGDERYAHKAAVWLHRIAEVYPAMDYHAQSRYGQMQAARNGRYDGKLVNLIWESFVLADLALAYDAVWETIDADTALQQRTGKTGRELRAFIERRVLEEGIQAVFDEKIRGNFGMHQVALVRAALARDTTRTEAWIQRIFDGAGESILNVGLDHALYNLVYPDGFPFETGPGYNFIWVTQLARIGRALREAEQSLFQEPKMPLVFQAPLNQVVIGRYTPSVGDSGTLYGSLVGRDAEVYRIAYERYGDPRFLRHLAAFGAVGDEGFAHGQSLFLPPLEAPGHIPGEPGRFPVQASRLFDGYGMAILNNTADTVALSMYYGQAGGHGHADRLHFDLFANGLPMMPDLGYPDFMNNFVPGIYTWSKNTIAHNTVTVDARKQPASVRGNVHAFADDSFARVVDVDAAATYPQCDTYRRTLVMIDVDEERSYAVDLFHVRGGRQHDYSLHGPPGQAELIGGEWTEPAPGTLAGEDVPVGAIYDDPKLGAPGYDGSFTGYGGSGFQHLTAPRRLRGGDWFAQYTHERPAGAPFVQKRPRDPDTEPEDLHGDPARLRIRVLDQPEQEIIVAHAQASPVKHKQMLQYVIARRQGESLDSRFVSVLEPYREEPFIESAGVVERYAEGGALVRVRRRDGMTDHILVNPAGVERAVFANLRTRARYAVATVGNGGGLVRWFSVPAERPQASPAGDTVTRPGFTGEIVAVRAEDREVVVDPDRPVANPAEFVGRVVTFQSPATGRHTAHTITEANTGDGGRLVLTLRDHLRIGRFRITQLNPGVIESSTMTAFGETMAGGFVSDDAETLFVPLREVRGETLHLAEELPDEHPLRAGGDAWVIDVAPGTRCAMPTVVSVVPAAAME